MTISLARSRNQLRPTSDEAAGSVSQALKSRRSVRAFSSEPVDDVLVNEILQTALLKGGVLPDGDYKTLLKYPKELSGRYFATGKGLYDVLGISRNDRKGRDSQMARNFSFFDAPTVLFIFCEDSLGPYGPLDTGIFVQSLLLAAQEQGVDTCVQGSVATWAGPVRDHFNIPAGYKLICGIAMGYGIRDSINNYKPARRKLDQLLLRSSPASD